MPRACTICTHVDRLSIDRLLVSNRSISAIARKYDLKNDALIRHRRSHLSRQLIQVQKQRDIFHGDSMLKLIQDLLTSSQNILSKCENKPSRFPIALKAIAESRRTVEFLWEINCRLQEYKADEQRQKHEYDDHTAIWEKGVKLMPTDELKKLSELTDKVMKLGSGNEQGKRNDLIRKTKQRIASDKHRRKKLAADKLKSQNDIPVKTTRKIKRRKPKPEPVDEFDQMRSRLGMDNNPPPIEPHKWTDPW